MRVFTEHIDALHCEAEINLSTPEGKMQLFQMLTMIASAERDYIVRRHTAGRVAEARRKEWIPSATRPATRSSTSSSCWSRTRLNRCARCSPFSRTKLEPRRSVRGNLVRLVSPRRRSARSTAREQRSLMPATRQRSSPRSLDGQTPTRRVSMKCCGPTRSPGGDRHLWPRRGGGSGLRPRRSAAGAPAAPA